MSELKKGDKVIVLDQGLMELYNAMKQFDPSAKPGNQGWVDSFIDEAIMVKFPIGDEAPDKHSQVAPYPSNLVVRKDW